LKDKISSFASKINLNDVNWIKYLYLYLIYFNLLVTHLFKY
jgi:hypothetical protein